MALTRSAVVIGASMGGLLAARALADTYDTVTVLDRDALPPDPETRRGVPQGHQLHVLLARGRVLLEELFPGLTAELTGHGVPKVDLHGGVHWYNDGFRMRRAPSDLVAVGMRRPLLEWVVRQRVAALPGVRILSRLEVVDLTATPDRRRVTGVRAVALDDGKRELEITADLVVDAGGKATRSPVWLERLGYRRAVEEHVKVDVTYVTGVFRHEPHHLEGMLGTLANAVPGAPRAGIVAVQEDGRVAVALSGILGEEPPTEPDAMAIFAKQLAAPQIAELLADATPLSEPVKMRFPASVRRRYEKLWRFPDGYLVMGDAMCSFNPIYGQGMTVAALQATRLRQLVAAGETKLARRFFRDAAKAIDAPWAIAVGTDLRFAEVVGPRSTKVRFVNWYVHRLHRAATHDTVLGAAFLRVLNLIDPPAALLAPSIAWRVARGSSRPDPGRA